MKYYFLITIFSCVFAFEKDITFTVPPGKIECFYQSVLKNALIDLEYQVIDSSHGSLDITFQLSNPVGYAIVTDYKKLENAHKYKSDLNGDFRFCFDNSFSSISRKTVFFDLLIENEDSVEKDYGDKEMELGDSAETYMMRVHDISESITRVKDSVSATRRLQELHSAHEARDRNLAEDMCSRVMYWSLWQIVVMLVVGLTQVIFLKSLFEDKNSRSLKKLIPGFGTR
ncbi:hypothetical protein ACJJTC_002601 [Scirpophaga incertulas]